MLKRIARLLSRLFSMDDESINRVTAKDAFVGFPLLMTIASWISWPFYPLFLLIEMFEGLATLIVLACAVVFQVTIYLIVTDGPSFWRVVLCSVSGFGLFGSFVLYPLHRRWRGRGLKRRGLWKR
jgi:hypothetical protein